MKEQFAAADSPLPAKTQYLAPNMAGDQRELEMVLRRNLYDDQSR